MATTTYGTTYVQSSDLVSNWPGSSLSVANRIDDVSLKGNGLNNQTGVTYTLVLADGGKIVTLSNASAVSVTIPTNASVAFPTGVVIGFTNKGAGIVTLAGAGGVTVNGADLTLSQNETAYGIKLDTNTWVVDKSFTAGLVKITDSTFSASSAVNVNNCFSSTYKGYRIILVISSSDGNGFTMRMRVGGTDNTSTEYRLQQITADGATLTSTRPAAGTSWSLGASSNLELFTWDMYNPAEAQITRASHITSATTGGEPQLRVRYLIHSVATAYDGFSLTPFTSGQTVTGVLRVYGYRD